MEIPPSPPPQVQNTVECKYKDRDLAVFYFNLRKCFTRACYSEPQVWPTILVVCQSFLQLVDI